MAGGALIPLLGKITPDLAYSIANAYIYTIHMPVVIQLPTNPFIFLHDYSHLEYIYNIYILYNPDGLYSNSEGRAEKVCIEEVHSNKTVQMMKNQREEWN